MLRTKWMLLFAAPLLLCVWLCRSNWFISDRPVDAVQHHKGSTRVNDVVQQKTTSFSVNDSQKTSHSTQQCVGIVNDDETEIIKQLLIEPLLSEPNRYDWDEDDSTGDGGFQGAPLEVIAEAARAGDPEAEALYGMQRIQQIPAAWADAFSSAAFGKLDEAEKMLQHANTVSPTSDLVYQMRSAYRVAVTVAWLNVDKVGTTNWQQLQRRFQKFDLLLQHSGNDRQFLQSHFDDLEMPLVINQFGLTLPPLPPPDPQLLLEAERSANDFGLSWRQNDGPRQQKIRHWFNHSQSQMNLAISCLAERAKPSS